MKILTLILVTLLLSCNKAELAPTDNRCQMIDPYNNKRCQNQYTIIDELKLCEQHYQIKYNNPTITNTTTEIETTQNYNNSSYNGNCQNSYSVTCGARTKKGTSCKNRTRSCNGKCYLHGG